MDARLCAVVVLCISVAASTSAHAQSGTAEESALEGTIQIGALVPITGDASRHGGDVRVAVELAESDFNMHLQEMGARWTLDVLIEDSATSPVIALEKLASLKAKKINAVVATYSSAELRNVMGYATSNNMMLISYASTAPSLGVPDDGIFRFIPDATHQGRVNAELFESLGITRVIPVWRGDAWGDGLVETTKAELEKIGGVMDDGIRYNPEAAEFSTEMALLSDRVAELAGTYGHDRIGVMLLAFSESVNIAQSSSQYEDLAKVRWVGSDTILNVGGQGSDRIASEFFDSRVTVTLFASPQNPVYERVSSEIAGIVGREPVVYSFGAYEAVWAFGLSMLAADSADTDLLVAALPGVLEERRGVFGKIVLNEKGDLDRSIYEVWRLRGSEWVAVGAYEPESGSIVWTDAAAVEEGTVGESVAGEDDPDGNIEAAGEGGGCLIATAAYGSELAPQVQLLREVRDDTLLRTDAGRSFMSGFDQVYYSFSPGVADIERENPAFRDAVRVAITPALYMLGIMSAADPDSGASVIVIGVATILAIAGVYGAAPSLATYCIVRGIRR